MSLFQWLGRQGAMRHSPINLENGPSKSVYNDKKWPIENFKIIEKSWKRPICKNLFPITAIFDQILIIFFAELFMRETSFIKRAIYRAHIGFTIYACPSVLLFWRHRAEHFNFLH